jgi:Lrp/AsnC family transcriptional regulator for asnA, asnC and gidA
MMIDDIDLKLILELQVNGRETFVDLGGKIGVSEGTVRKRYKRLVDEGIISVTALPNVRKMGFNVIGVMAIQVRMEDLNKAADTLAQDGRVCYLTMVAGRYDLIAIIVAKSTEDLYDFIEHKITSVSGIVRSETLVSLSNFKGTLPLVDISKLMESISH